MRIAKLATGTRSGLARVGFVITLATVTLAGVFTAPAVAYYYPIVCHKLTETGMDNGYLCIGKDSSSSHNLFGRFYNGNTSGADVYNQLYYRYSPSGTYATGCSYTWTSDNSSYTCTATFPSGQPAVQLCTDYYYQSQWYGFCSSPAIPS
jgi:hypothetical protein